MLRRRLAVIRSLGVVLLLALGAAILAGCAGGSLVGSLSAHPARLTPNGDRIDDVAAIAYSLTRPAQVSLYVVDAASTRHPLREALRRPVGTYEATFDGTVPATGDANGRQMLASGEYRLVLEALDEAGRREEREVRLTLAEPDLARPALEAVAANPPAISPYDPSMQSETRLSYRLSEAATVTLFVVEPDGRRTRLSEAARREPGEHAQVWNGLVRNKVPQAGTYTLVVQATDAAGNAVEKGAAVAVSGTEEPDATIVRVAFSPHAVIKGDVVKVAITVRNTGDVTLRSHGPDSGYTYTTLDTYASVEGGRYADKAHYWRVGVDWAGGLGPEGSRYPYRWSLGKDLAPGEETTVEGYIRILEDYASLRFYAGLIHEKVKYHVDRVGQQIIEVSK